MTQTLCKCCKGKESLVIVCWNLVLRASQLGRKEGIIRVAGLCVDWVS